MNAHFGSAGRVKLGRRRTFHALVLVFLSSVLILAPPASSRAQAASSPTATGTLITLNKGEDTASLIDLATGEVFATLATGAAPHEVAVSPDGSTAVATNYGSRETAGSTLTVIDIPSAAVTHTFDLAPYKRPHGIQWLADGKHLLVTAEDNQKLLTVRVADGKVVGEVTTGQSISHMVAVTPGGKRAFVANIGSGTVSAVDLEAGKLLEQIATGEGAEGIAVTPDGREAWVTNRSADTLSVIDASSLEIVATLDAPSFPIRVRITPDGKWALVSTARSGELAVFDVAGRKEFRRITMDHAAEDTEGRLFGGRFGDSSVPIGILIHPDGASAYVANANADIISIVDLTTWKTAGVLRAGREPDGLAFSAYTYDGK